MQSQPAKDETPPNALQFGGAQKTFASNSEQVARVAGLEIHEHELVRRIGRGAYGEVWLARNALGTCRAVKIVYRKDFEDSRPFEREFAGIQKFEPISRSHPGLVNILQVGRREDYFYYVMELADGAEDPKPETRNSKEARNPNSEPVAANDEIRNSTSALPSAFDLRPSDLYRPRTLREELRQTGRLPAERCVEIGLALTSALAHLHRHGLVHRDVKPSNIIFVQRAPKLADIGLVTEAGDSRSIVGTEGYLPPEGPGTPQADIFSLGKVLYEISTGQDRRRLPDLPPDLKDWPDTGLVCELNEVILKACAFDVRQRYQSAEEMRAELLLMHQGQSVLRKRAIQQCFSVSKKAGLAMSLLALIATAVVLLRSPGGGYVHSANPEVNRLVPGDGYVHSANPEVNKLVEQANQIVQDRTPDQIRRAREYFKQAIALEPRYVPALFGVFRTYLFGGGADYDAPADKRLGLREAAAKLKEIDRDCAETHAASSMIKWIGWQFPEARAEARLATQNQTRAACTDGRALAYLLLGFYLVQSGKPDEALKEYQSAEALLPNRSILQHHLGHPYFVKRDFDNALKHYGNSLDLRPQQWPAHYFIASIYEEQKDFMAAIKELEEGDRAIGRLDAKKMAFYEGLREAVRQDPVKGYWDKRLDLALHETHPNPYYVATLYARLGERDKAYARLEEAVERQAFNQGLMFDLCWKQDDPRFIDIARRIGLKEE